MNIKLEQALDFIYIAQGLDVWACDVGVDIGYEFII